MAQYQERMICKTSYKDIHLDKLNAYHWGKSESVYACLLLMQLPPLHNQRRQFFHIGYYT